MEKEGHQHGEHYEENGETYMDDHINGMDWHIPKERDPEDEYTEDDREIDEWLNN